MKSQTTSLLLALTALTSAPACVEDPLLDRLRECRAPKVLGHRGTRVGAPENTLPAFQWAMEHGADGVEVDVKRTQDGELVAFHDRTTQRTTNDGAPRLISTLTLGELRLLDAGGWFGPGFRDIKVPTLREVREAIPHDALFNIDHMRAEFAADVAAFVRETGSDNVLVSGFDEEGLRAAAEVMPDVTRVLFVNDTTIDEFEALMLEQAEVAQADIVRIPKDIEGDPRALHAVLSAGFDPGMGTEHLQWVGGVVFSDNAAKARKNIEESRPAFCAPP